MCEWTPVGARQCRAPTKIIHQSVIWLQKAVFESTRKRVFSEVIEYLLLLLANVLQVSHGGASAAKRDTRSLGNGSPLSQDTIRA
ncbi:hypothetical protein H6G00_31625, partial [Leptolyngbya sp. FACHB-541]|uniref:hypothetical protein n=1 Tax=Leptolyngbya sp. FACHB-541 TaxID=2692810 RepID=UPI00168812DE